MRDQGSLQGIIQSQCLALFYDVFAKALFDSELPVCIIGAGASGLSAAHSLEALGRSTVIFEQRDTVGGYAQNYYENGLPFHLGPILIQNGSHPETIKIVNDVGVLTTTYTAASAWFFNWTTGETWALPPAEPSPDLLEEVVRYTAHWQKIYGSFAQSAYTENVPEELTLSTYEWFSRYNYPLLQARFTRYIIDWGYGDVDELPIFYMLSVFAPTSIGATPLRVDYHEVFQRYARQLTASTILLRSKITAIDRTTDIVTIHYHYDAAQHEQPCSHLIIAFAPTLLTLSTAGLDLSPAEETVFSAVQTTNYFSTAIRLSNTPRLAEFNIATDSAFSFPEIAGQPVYIEGEYNSSDVSLLYALGREDQSPEQVAAVTLQTLSRINGDPQVAATGEGEESRTPMTLPVEPRDIKALRQHPHYFPHFNQSALRGGWYDMFNALQGGNRTFYTSGLNRAEHVEYVIVSAREVVERFLGS
ncbi:hypothetical protein BJX64DRAFT_294389 [Aspergillus heterothallicus]